LTAYLDTSVLVSMFTADDHTPRTRSWLAGVQGPMALSDWTVTEFSSALAVGLRVGRLTASEVASAEDALDTWLGRSSPPLTLAPQDVREARRFIRSIGVPLRAGDALHLALARRAGLSVATLDLGMRRAAEHIGLAVAAI
jgi:predicted nucleic acid-binding protein